MPLYEYECEACRQRFEVIEKYSETTETCRACGKGPVQRLASSPAIQFKGSGWYITDYARKGASPEGAADKTDKSGDAKTGEGKPADATSGAATPADAKTDTTADRGKKAEPAPAAASSAAKDSK